MKVPSTLNFVDCRLHRGLTYITNIVSIYLLKNIGFYPVLPIRFQEVENNNGSVHWIR